MYVIKAIYIISATNDARGNMLWYEITFLDNTLLLIIRYNTLLTIIPCNLSPLYLFSYLVTNLMGADLNNIVKFQRLSDEHVQFLIYQLLRGLKVFQGLDLIALKCTSCFSLHFAFFNIYNSFSLFISPKTVHPFSWTNTQSEFFPFSFHILCSVNKLLYVHVDVCRS